MQVVTLIQPTNLVKRKPVGFLTNNPKLTWSLYFLWIQPIRSNDDVHHVSQSVMTGFFLIFGVFCKRNQNISGNESMFFAEGIRRKNSGNMTFFPKKRHLSAVAVNAF